MFSDTQTLLITVSHGGNLLESLEVNGEDRRRIEHKRLFSSSLQRDLCLSCKVNRLFCVVEQ